MWTILVDNYKGLGIQLVGTYDSEEDARAMLDALAYKLRDERISEDDKANEFWANDTVRWFRSSARVIQIQDYLDGSFDRKLFVR